MSNKPNGRFLCLLLVSGLVASGCGGAETRSTYNSSRDDLSPEEEAKYYMEQAGLSRAEDDNEQALAYYLEAAKVYERIGDVTIDRAESHFLAADLAYGLENPDESLAQYQAAVDIYLRFSGNSKIKAAVALNNMGTIYKELEKKDKAQNCWENALQIYKDAPPELQSRSHMATIEQNLNDLREGF